ncbi:MAG: hypothetical protein Q7T56_13060 [Nocardioidaceae bacterium]|nr:hypothetical protein [Nocardioidaceae bacterium]
MPDEKKKTAGAFDIRVIIAALLGVYGVILVLLGIFNATDAELARGDGLNINLWGGLGMVVVAALFVTWARLRPVVLPPDFEAEEERKRQER